MVDILAIGAHPDDLEFGVGGILVKAAAEGKSIALCDLTNGENGTNGTPDIRRKEALKAAELLGAEREFLEIPDCEVMDTCEARYAVARVIRKHKPKLVLAPMWKGTQNHPDHLATGLIARHACRYARFKSVMTELPPHSVQGILHYPTLAVVEAEILVDITDHMEAWKKLIHCHKSQLATKPYDEWCIGGAKAAGHLIDVEYAQGVVVGNPIVVDDIMHVARGTMDL